MDPAIFYSRLAYAHSPQIAINHTSVPARLKDLVTLYQQQQPASSSSSSSSASSAALASSASLSSSSSATSTSSSATSSASSPLSSSSFSDEINDTVQDLLQQHDNQKQHYTELIQHAYKMGFSDSAQRYEARIAELSNQLNSSQQTIVSLREAIGLAKNIDLYEQEQLRTTNLQKQIEKMKVPISAKPSLAPTICMVERNAVIECLKGKNDPLVCNALSVAFQDCAKKAVLKRS